LHCTAVLSCATYVYWNTSCYFFFFFNDTATPEIYTLSLHDALPIWEQPETVRPAPGSTISLYPSGTRQELTRLLAVFLLFVIVRDRKSTRLNSSHDQISYAVFCLKKKKNNLDTYRPYILFTRHLYLV